MEIETIERYVDEVLEVKGLVKGGQEQQIRLLLSHLYTAVQMYRLMNDDDKAQAMLWHKAFKDVFPLKKFFKERKRKREKKKSPLHPSYKETEPEDKEKDEKTPTPNTRERLSEIEKKQMAFWEELQPFISPVGKYSRQLVLKFFYYWAEEVNGTGMMLRETRRSWNTKYRLAGWARKPYELDAEAARLRLERAKGKATRPATDSVELRAIAAEREAENARREAELAESRKNSISLEEYAKTHPDSQLARQFCKKGGGT